MPTPSAATSEWLTRKRIIDGKLRAAGWEVVPFKKAKDLRLSNAAIEEFETGNGPADYALCRDGRILGVVEAKKLSLGPQNVLIQAERYSKGVAQPGIGAGTFGVPFLYSTNGEVIWHHDVRSRLNTSREISGFHTPTALDEFLNTDFDANIAHLRQIPNDGARLRPYQREANSGIEAAIAARRRRMLVAMATGTGKTFTIVNEI
jgi:type I restriction enzyme, R subunit